MKINYLLFIFSLLLLALSASQLENNELLSITLTLSPTTSASSTSQPTSSSTSTSTSFLTTSSSITVTTTTSPISTSVTTLPATTVSSTTSSISEYQQQFTDWMIQYNKSYTNNDFLTRFNIFVDNLLYINQFNSLTGNDTEAMKLGTNIFADLTLDEFANTYLVKDLLNFSVNSNTTSTSTSTTTTGGGLLGGLLTGALTIGTGGSTSGGGGGGLLGGLLTGASQPSSSTLRTLMESRNWIGRLPPIKDQGECGSCYAFASLVPIESLLYGKGSIVSLSAQEIVDCSNFEGNSGCDGGWMSNVYGFVRHNIGVSTEQEYPYIGSFQTCTWQLRKKYGIVNKDFVVTNQTAMEDVLTNVGPVAIALQARVSSFQLYKSGIYEDAECGKGQVDHAVALVGLGVESGKPYYTLSKSKPHTMKN
ncbi:Cathepsin L -like protein [Heterostelium album PN500]|uniref:Cathepsin L-like protein n=1 Tax=Heterostelium pallidum (strain ATCC 26659 / Pp 5 / PN500) TaxID=670386 RepID=D3B354_HETP5|nr:Cathepsin L -like protein [Heterostelium album PN500]EFA83752.1 Cathepsin L -like protein [Heterostelium album PN500]|eukprot:XP_020435869.1 Cathepsin L -like protein [Heterostelium album PN500]